MAELEQLIEDVRRSYPGFKKYVAALRAFDMALLKEFCNMGYHDECRPEWCEYRMTNTCRFWKEYEAVQKSLSDSGILVMSSFPEYYSRVLGMDH